LSSFEAAPYLASNDDLSRKRRFAVEMPEHTGLIEPPAVSRRRSTTV
jgi:hypothetical protein